MRGDGGCACAIGAAGFATTEAGAGGGMGDAGATECGAAATGGVAAGGFTGRTGTGIAEGAAADTGGWAGTEDAGFWAGAGNLGCGTVAEVAAGVSAAGPAAAAGREGAVAPTGACCFRMALRTSPGLEILERSILVLISSLSARLGRECLVEV